MITKVNLERRQLLIGSVAAGVAGATAAAVSVHEGELGAPIRANMSLSRTAYTNLSPEQMADRVAIRELVDAYAHCADRRDLAGQMSLFTAGVEFLLFNDSRSAEPTQKINGREGLRPLFEGLKSYEATTHFNGQMTITWGHDSVSGELNCLAHLVKVDASQRTLTVVSVRYLDQFVKLGGLWYINQRKALLDWSDSRPSTPGS
jgi:SnoaL-like domain